MIVTIVAVATIIQKFHWMIAKILMIHDLHMIVVIAGHFIVECIKADDGYSVFTCGTSTNFNSRSTEVELCDIDIVETERSYGNQA